MLRGRRGVVRGGIREIKWGYAYVDGIYLEYCYLYGMDRKWHGLFMGDERKKGKVT